MIETKVKLIHWQERSNRKTRSNQLNASLDGRPHGPLIAQNRGRSLATTYNDGVDHPPRPASDRISCHGLSAKPAQSPGQQRLKDHNFPTDQNLEQLLVVVVRLRTIIFPNLLESFQQRRPRHRILRRRCCIFVAELESRKL